MKKNNIPALRFPQFNEPWEVKKLGEVGEFISNKIAYSEVCSDNYISTENILSENKGITLSSNTPKSGNVTKYKKGDILLSNIRPYLKKIWHADRNGGCSNDILCLSENNDNISNNYLFCILNQSSFFEYIMLGAKGTKMPRGDKSHISNFPISLPTLPEQQKIADFLSGVDEKIGQLERRLALEEQYKKGMMQRLFDQEIRFKDDNGNEFPDWEEKKLGEVCEIKSGLSKEQNTTNSGYKVTRIETISEGYVNADKIGYVDTDTDMTAYKLNIGDILFSNINSVSHIGKTAIILSNNSLYHGMNLLRIVSSKRLIPHYLFYTLNTYKYRNYFKSICNQAVSQASINQTELSKTNISLPSLPEQQKIADFLSSLDEKIGQTKAELEKARVWKRGLMQRMFV